MLCILIISQNLSIHVRILIYPHPIKYFEMNYANPSIYIRIVIENLGIVHFQRSHSYLKQVFKLLVFLVSLNSFSKILNKYFYIIYLSPHSMSASLPKNYFYYFFSQLNLVITQMLVGLNHCISDLVNRIERLIKPSCYYIQLY